MEGARCLEDGSVTIIRRDGSYFAKPVAFLRQPEMGIRKTVSSWFRSNGLSSIVA